MTTNPKQFSDLLTLPEAAKVVGVSERTLRRYIEDGKLEAYRLGPSQIRIDPNALSVLLQPFFAVKRGDK